jgi:hypothetical protein
MISKNKTYQFFLVKIMAIIFTHNLQFDRFIKYIFKKNNERFEMVVNNMPKNLNKNKYLTI